MDKLKYRILKKGIILIVLIISANAGQAQQKYFPFSINGKYGITDTLGNLAMKPDYYRAQVIRAKKQIYLQDFSRRPDVIFDEETGKKQFYESVYDDQVKINDVPFTLINNKGKKYLLSEETTKTISLTEEYTDFKNEGKFIIAQYYPKSVPSNKSTVDKNGRPLPPRIEPPPSKHMAVLSNDVSLKRLIKGDFESYILLYKVPEEEKNDGIVREVHAKLIDLTQVPDFDFIVFTKGNTHTLYNGKLALIKTFVLAKATENRILEASKKIVNHNLATFFEGQYPSPSVGMAPPGMPRTKGVEQKIIDKKPFKPFFYTKKLDNGNTLFALQETEEISNHILEAKPGVSLSLNEQNFTITVEREGKKDSKFSFNPKTGAIYLPKAYVEILGLSII